MGSDRRARHVIGNVRFHPEVAREASVGRCRLRSTIGDVQILQRPDWYGAPIRLSRVWHLIKGRRQAECAVYSHQFGWELRLVAGVEVLQTRVCRSQDDVLNTYDEWKRAMLGAGWKEGK